MAKKSAAKKAPAKKTPVKKSNVKKAPAKKAGSKAAAKKPAAKLKAAPKPAAKPTQKSTPKAAAKIETPKLAKPFAKAVGAMKRFSPLDDRILIERVVAPEKTAGGLYIPDSAQEKPTLGKVVAVGRGHRDAKGRTRPCDVKVGDQVLFTAWSGSEIEVDGNKFVIMRETDLLGVTTA
jgi:chaperonin GroES